MRHDIEDVCKRCDNCQRNKKSFTKYGKLPAKEAEANPWEKVAVDLIGPYIIKRNNQILI